MAEEIFVKLRYCFIAGYTFPQYCIDNKIRKPLIISEKKFESFVQEVYAQFKCDKRLMAQFCFYDGDNGISRIPMKQAPLISECIVIKTFSEIKLEHFDRIILLTNENIATNLEKVISFAELEKFFIRRTYVEIPLLNFLQRYPKVKLFLTNFPRDMRRYEGGTEFNSKIWDYRPLQKTLIENESKKGEHFPTPFDKFGYTNSQTISLLKDARTISHSDGTTTMQDDNDPLIRIQEGKRMTAYQPKNFLNKIYIFGTCLYFGVYAPYDKTIASYLQKMLNENNLPYRVENEGQCFWNRHQDMFYNLNALAPVPNDIIFIRVNDMPSNNNIIPFCDMSDAFDPPHDYKEIFCIKNHVNELGYKLIAEKYFKFLTENNFFREVYFNYPTPPPRYITDMVYLRNLNRAT